MRHILVPVKFLSNSNKKDHCNPHAYTDTLVCASNVIKMYNERYFSNIRTVRSPLGAEIKVCHIHCQNLRNCHKNGTTVSAYRVSSYEPSFSPLVPDSRMMVLFELAIYMYSHTGLQGIDK